MCDTEQIQVSDKGVHETDSCKTGARANRGYIEKLRLSRYGEVALPMPHIELPFFLFFQGG